MFMRIIIFIVFLLPLFGRTQSFNWLPGEVLYPDGRIEKGVIEYKPWSKNPATINFSRRTDSLFIILSADISILLPSYVSEVRINGKDIYRGAIVTRYMNQLDVKHISETLEEPEIKEPVFLRLLTAGKSLSLYSYIDHLKTHYFVLDSTGIWTTLRYVRHTPERGLTLVEDRIYKEQLNQYLGNNEKAKKKLSSVMWSDEDLISLIKLINQNSEVSYAEAEQKALQKSFGFFAGFSAAKISFRITSNDELIDNLRFNTVYRPVLFGGYRFSGGRSLSKLVFQVLFGWYSYSVEGKYNWSSAGTPATETLLISTNNIFLTTETLLTFSENPKFSFEIGLGFNSVFPLSVSSKRTTTEKNINGQPLIRDQFNLNNRAHINAYGVMQFRILKKHSIRGMIIPAQKIDDFASSKPLESLILLGYHFTFPKR
jgi:hypothetical protein